MTFADWLKTQNIPEDQQWGIRTGAILTFGAPPEQLSFLWVLFYTHSAGSYAELEGTAGEGAQALRVTGGSQALSLRMAQALGERVHLNTQVTHIRHWNGAGPCVIETNNGAFRTKRVIMALSPSQAALIDFDPGLPAQRVTLQQGWPKISDMTKAAVVYETPFWREAGFSGQSFTLDGGAYLFAWDNSPPDAGVGVISCFVPVLPDAAITSHKAALVETYVKCFGPKAAEPIGYHEQDWMPERFTRGCVSPLGPGLLTQHGDALRPTLGCLEWAGTETALIWNGYMDGGVRAGHEAALRALRAV
jgi:monoamine oxidase